MQLTKIVDTARKIRPEPPYQVPRKFPSSYLVNFGYPSEKFGQKIQGKPPIQHVHKVHTDSQSVRNGHGRESEKKEYPRCWTTHIVNIKPPGHNNNRDGHIIYLQKEEPPHQPTPRKAALKSARKIIQNVR